MPNQTPSRLEIRAEARKMLSEGNSRQQTFEELSHKYKKSQLIADIMRSLPSKMAIQQYRKWNFVLLALLIITMMYQIWQGAYSVVVVYYGFLIYIVARMRVKFYIWVSVLAAIAIISLSAILITSSNEEFGMLDYALTLLIAIPTLIMPFWLENKLCPKPIERKKTYTKPDGRKRSRIVYTFPDV